VRSSLTHTLLSIAIVPKGEMAEDMANEVTNTIADAINCLKEMEKAYKKSKEPENIPDAFHEVHKKVELVKNTLGCVEDWISDHVHDQKSCEEIKTNVDGCKQKAENLQTLFRKVVPWSEKPKLDRYREVARDLGGVGENRVEALMVGLLGDVQNLVAKCTIQQKGKTIEGIEKGKIEELTAAVEELSALAPSLVEDPAGNSVNNWSTGTQNVNAGKGTQNNNTGAGMQYIGHTQNFNSHNPNVST
jgi:hypothetical protein